MCFTRHFYPRSPCGERPLQTVQKIANRHFYPRSPCGERRSSRAPTGGHRYFYPRSPCGERPVLGAVTSPAVIKFLSTLSLRRATVPRRGTGACHRDFYPRSPCGERRCDGQPQSGWTDISIHALLAESDVLGAVTSPAVRRFLSTLSLRRATLSDLRASL